MHPVIVKIYEQEGEGWVAHETAIVHLQGGRITLVDAEDYGMASQWAWSAGKIGRGYYAVRNPGKYGTIYLHREIMKAQRYQRIDHKNGITLDNRKCNLRFATPKQNAMNKAGAAGRLLPKGVMARANGKFSVHIAANGRKAFLGDYGTPVEAGLAYDAAARIMHGEFARLNYPGMSSPLTERAMKAVEKAMAEPVKKPAAVVEMVEFPNGGGECRRAALQPSRYFSFDEIQAIRDKANQKKAA